jgi:branched-chain amino acid transport system substrate-binding protein
VPGSRQQLRIAPLVTEVKIPTVIMLRAAPSMWSSPYVLRTSFTLGQQSATLANRQSRTEPGGSSPPSRRVDTGVAPEPGLRAVLQRARDAQPDTLFVSFPSAQAGTFAKQFVERGFDKSPIRIIGPDAYR